MKLFTNDWTEEQIYKVKSAINRYFIMKSFVNHRGEKQFIGDIEIDLGLPYTSISMCPMLGVVPKENEYGKIMIDETYNIYDASPCDRCKYDNNRGVVCDSCDEYGDNTYYE